MEESQLHIVDLKSKDMLRKIENGIVYGLPVLLQDVLEELDPALEPVSYTHLTLPTILLV